MASITYRVVGFTPFPVIRVATPKNLDIGNMMAGCSATARCTEVRCVGNFLKSCTWILGIENSVSWNFSKNNVRRPRDL